MARTEAASLSPPGECRGRSPHDAFPLHRRTSVGESRTRLAGKTFRVWAWTAVAVAALTACTRPPGTCWTAERYEREAADNPKLVGVRLGRYPGEIVIENPGNFWVDARFTGQSCETHVIEEGTRVFAKVSFLQERVELKVPLSTRDFYLGRVDHGHMLVLQQIPGGAIASVVGFDDNGIMNYQDCRQRGAPYRECHGSRKPGMRADGIPKQNDGSQ